ncbi:MAG: hypothetical protein FJ030_19225 [Chloroflexi bacterium]|nr:hypothetical protein [Chloroflexota bacterium]
MVAAKNIVADSEADQIYHQALDRLERELGWPQGKSHDAIAELAAGYGVFLHDVARAVLSAPSVKYGLGRALLGAPFDHRPMPLRGRPAR